MMDRRNLVLSFAGSVLAAPALAQRARPRIGLLVTGDSDFHARLLPKALHELGYRPGETIDIVVRGSGQNIAALPALADELLAAGVDILVAVLTPAGIAAKRATTRVPIVLLVGDAVAAGLVDSLARPGGNITGASLSSVESAGKSIEVIKDAMPGAQRISALMNSNDPFMAPQVATMRHGAALIGMDIDFISIREVSELDAAFASAIQFGADAIFFQSSLPRTRALARARELRLPIVSISRAVTQEGGLLSYASSIQQGQRIVADSIDRILKGARPGDIPMQQPTRFELVVNLSTARAISLTLPAAFLARADEVIE